MAVKRASAYFGNIDSIQGDSTPVSTTNGATPTVPTTPTQTIPDKEAAAQAANSSAAIAKHSPYRDDPGYNKYESHNDTANARSIETKQLADTMNDENLAKARSLSDEDYYDDQHKNVAKGEAESGQLNNRTFESTMHASRLADYYNNRPQEDVPLAVSSTSGQAVTQGAGYTRPQINTQEMRQMREAEALDKERQSERIQLQGAIDRVPMEDFNTWKAQNVANAAGTRELQNQLNAAMAGAKAGQSSSINTTEFAQKLAHYLNGQKAQIVMDAIGKGDYQLATLLLGIFTGGNSLITADDFYTAVSNRTLYEFMKQTGANGAYARSALLSRNMPALNELNKAIVSQALGVQLF